MIIKNIFLYKLQQIFVNQNNYDLKRNNVQWNKKDMLKLKFTAVI